MKVILIMFSVTLMGCQSVSLVTLDRSWHYFDEKGENNEKHGGLGLEISDGARTYNIIKYTNSQYGDSILISTSRDGWVTGLASGYDGVKILPFAAYQLNFFKYFRLTLTPIVAYTSIVLPFE